MTLTVRRRGPERAPASPPAQARLRTTPARQRVLEVIEAGRGRHLTVDDVFRQLVAQGEHVSLATVYRSLQYFEKARILRRSVLSSGKAVYAIDEGTPHGHLICRRCGHIAEFTASQSYAEQRRIARAHGYEFEWRGVTIYGLCRICRAPPPARNRPEAARPEAARSEAPGGTARIATGEQT